MKRACLFLLLAAAACRAPAAPRRETPPIEYPPATRGSVVDVLHGVSVPDPYRWLEDVDAPETRAWIEAQNALTERVLSSVPEREAIRKRLLARMDYERYGVPTLAGGRLFYRRNEGLQDQDVLWTSTESRGEPRVLIDPNVLSEDGTVSLTEYFPTRDGSLLAYGLSSGGSDWVTLRVRDVKTGRDLADEIRWVKFADPAWLPDGSGFYYARFPEPAEGEALRGVNEHHKVYFHRIGTPQEEDRLVHEAPDVPKRAFYPAVTEDGRYLVIGMWEGGRDNNAYAVKDLAEDGPVVPLLPEFDANYGLVGNDGRTFWFYTDKDAPNGRVVAVSLDDPAPETWRELIPEGDDAIESVGVVGDRFVVRTLHDAHSRLGLYGLDGTFDKQVELPGIGSVGGFDGRRDQRVAYYSFTGFTHPRTVYRYDFDAGKSDVFAEPEVGVDLDAFETRQVWYASKDGTRIPMFVVHKKGLERDGTHPVYLTGYGGFSISETPFYSSSVLVWLEMGGVFAMPNLRGGGEYGEAWHDAGRLANKQNVFDDFIAAAECLIAEGYTRPARLAIAGGSNGGLLVGACMTQRPDLFGACLPAVGVMDMLRFHRFTIGHAWIAEYGSPDVEEDFEILRAYSPLHNLEPGTEYPATLITTGDHDDRVHPGHSLKFAAALQHCQEGDEPVLLRVETRAGHGRGTPLTKVVEQVSDRYAFLVMALDMKLPSSFSTE